MSHHEQGRNPRLPYYLLLLLLSACEVEGVRQGMNSPAGLYVDSDGTCYFSDYNHTISRVTPTGEYMVLAGQTNESGHVDGFGALARFNRPGALTADRYGNVYVVDSGSAIRKVSAAGEVTTLAGSASAMGSADGMGSDARFMSLHAIAVDRVGNLYVTDTYSGTVRKITAQGRVTTLAGVARELGHVDGERSVARFKAPRGIAVDSAATVFVSDSGTIRRISASGQVSTLAGDAYEIGGRDGRLGSARFGKLVGVAIDSWGTLYLADTNNSSVRKLSQSGTVTTLAGLSGHPGFVDASGPQARFASPDNLSVDSQGNVYVSDSNNHNIRKITPQGMVTTLYSSLAKPAQVAVEDEAWH